MANYALITAGGVGNRMGQNVPKQFMNIYDVPVIIYTLKAFQNVQEIDGIAVVCLSGWEVVLAAYANQYGITKLKWIFPGGKTNQESIFRGLMGLKEEGCKDEDIVLVHDGVRPLVSSRIIVENIEKCKKFNYAVTGLMCKEAIMLKEDDCLNKLGVERENLVRTQTPHTYQLKSLLEAHEKANQLGVVNTVASCTLMAELGIDSQHLVIGTEYNGLKLTQPEDVEIFKALISTNKEFMFNKK